MPKSGKSVSCTEPFLRKLRSRFSTTPSPVLQEITSRNVSTTSERLTAVGQCVAEGCSGQCVQGEKSSRAHSGGGGASGGRTISSVRGSSVTSKARCLPLSSVNVYLNQRGG